MASYVSSIPIFQGAQGKFYLLHGYKYHVCFPIEWALHHNNGSSCGPLACRNCQAYGTIRGVFVGYCGSCVENYKNFADIWRGNYMGGLDVNNLNSETIWRMYPYMFGVRKSQIGDEPGAIIEDEEEEDIVQHLERSNIMHWNDDEHYYDQDVDEPFDPYEGEEQEHHVVEMNQYYDSDSETVVLDFEYE